MNSASQRTTSAQPRALWAAGLFVAGCAIAACISSCRRSGTTSGNDDRQATGPKCRQILESALDMVEPTKLGVTTGIDSVANRLNDWRRDCPNDKPGKKLGPDGRRLLEKLLTKADLDKRDNAVFQSRDVRHLRNSLVFAHVVKRLPHGSDLEQTVALFYFVTHNVALEKDAPDRLPLPVFYTLLFGRGTARDRAWLFGALLRQLKITAVILTPSDGPAADEQSPERPFLVGVLLEEPVNQKGVQRVYLFDTRLGLPVPGPDDDRSNPLPQKPATLKQFVEEASIARSLSTAEHPYRLKGSDLRRPRVGLIGHRSLYSPLMRRLLYTVGGAYKSFPYAELDGDNGLVALVAEFGKGRWKREEIEIWPYPEQTYRRFEAMTEEQRGRLTALKRPFEAPIEYSLNKQRKAVTKGWLHLLFKARVLHVTASYSRALEKYLAVLVRLPDASVMNTLPDAVRTPLVICHDDTEFWSAACQYARGDVAAAEKNLRHYLTVGRRWAPQARYLLALCFVRQKKFASARTTLIGGARDNPTFALLRDRWSPYGKTKAD